MVFECKSVATILDDTVANTIIFRYLIFSKISEIRNGFPLYLGTLMNYNYLPLWFEIAWIIISYNVLYYNQLGRLVTSVSTNVSKLLTLKCVSCCKSQS